MSMSTSVNIGSILKFIIYYNNFKSKFWIGNSKGISSQPFFIMIIFIILIYTVLVLMENCIEESEIIFGTSFFYKNFYAMIHLILLVRYLLVLNTLRRVFFKSDHISL